MQPWNSARAALFGAGIGAAAAAFKLFGPWAEVQDAAGAVREIVGAALAFALLCGAAAALRNLIARRLIWRDRERRRPPAE
jgi:hypothetical protein